MIIVKKLGLFASITSISKVFQYPKKVATYLWSTKMLFAHCYVLRTQGNSFCYAEFRCYLLANIFKNPPSNIILVIILLFLDVILDLIYATNCLILENR